MNLDKYLGRGSKKEVDDAVEFLVRVTKDKTTKKQRAQKAIMAGQSVKIGRNDLCPCDSGKKYKKCCINK